jgi:hypothetical protein
MSLRLWSVPGPGRHGWLLEPAPWLQQPVPRVDTPARDVHLNDGYQDRVLVLTAEELRRWCGRDRPRALEPAFDHPGWRPVIERELAELDRVLSEEPVPLFFLAHWFEWESGLGD